MKTHIFGYTSDLQLPVELYEIENKNGMTLSIINYGARIIGLTVPSIHGDLVNIVCGLKTLEDYEKDEFYFGAIVGRCAGRIYPATVKIGQQVCNLTVNAGHIHLHGGLKGFDKTVWKAVPMQEEDGQYGVRLRHVSPAGTEGYPGDLCTEVEYRLTDDNEVIVQVHATCKDETIVNIPQHAYFNLGGPNEPNIYNHIVSVKSDSHLPMEENSIPTGKILPVQDTVFDFRQSRNLGDAIASTPNNGYDDYFCLTSFIDPEHIPKHSANVYHPGTGINMEILTTQPGILMYTGNYLNKSVIGRDGQILDRHSCISFETQNYPNAVNEPAFPSPLVRFDTPYDHTTIWRFTKLPKVESVTSVE